MKCIDEQLAAAGEEIGEQRTPSGLGPSKMYFFSTFSKESSRRACSVHRADAK